MERFVYNQKYAKLLISLTGKTAQIDELAKSNDINAGHLRNVIDQWCKEGVISKDKSGREYNITLTEKGETISEKLADLVEAVNNYVPKVKEEKPETKVLSDDIVKKSQETTKETTKGVNNEPKSK